MMLKASTPYRLWNSFKRYKSNMLSLRGKDYAKGC